METAEDDFDVDVEVDFIGRETDLKRIYKAWGKHRIFGIFGLRSVGKSRLVKEFLTRYKSKEDVIVNVDVKPLSNSSSLYSHICVKLGIKTEANARESERWIHHIVSELVKRSEENFILVFDNTEDYQEFKGTATRDSFLSLCSQVIKRCSNVKIILTSTTRVQFAGLGHAYFSYKVLPLKRTETKRLLRSVIWGTDLGEYEDSIVTLSEGLPLLILMIGSELTEDDGMLTPEDIVECLLTSRLKTLSREFYPKEDRVADVYKDFIDRLASVYREKLTILEYIPGTFNVDQVSQLLDAETEAIVKYDTLKPILGRHFLSYDPTTRRFNIQGILRECLQSYYTIKNLPEVRARYCKIFTAVMVNISKRLGTTEYTEAMAEFTVEHPNLQKLLTDVKYTRQDTYHFFIKIATDCTVLVDQFMAGDGEDFYQGCMRIANMYGKDRDRANVHIAVGSLYTNIKGHLVRGADNYDSAIAVFEKYGKSLQLATAYQRKGWNLYSQGKNLEAVKFLKQAFDLSVSSGKEYQSILLQSLNSLGLTNTVLGRFEEAERYHFESLKRRKEIQGEDHPFVGACLNNIGIMYYLKGDSHKALKFYEEGLEIKRKSATPVISLVNSLSNTANMYSETGNSKKAHILLDEAIELLNKEKVPCRDAAALLCDTKGKVYRREGAFKFAEDMFQKAIDVRKEISDENVPYLESLVHLANINKRQGNYISCIRISNKALTIKEKAEIAMPQHPFIKECLECLVEVYKKTDDKDKCKETLEKLESELIRLEKVHLDHGNERDLLKVRTQMHEIKAELEMAPKL
ncbi:nephrocystin-3-like isoform X2 [Mercenaria mercenaria]|uniref:nephrocystin-3-like isoform X2 n=1 Tax=Mercenaria mercenaria TaxID=6596 RepID=UPI00234F9479|nr:nephrocystin-3-like isoform X2 [Mercenaria mercenaria]